MVKVTFVDYGNPESVKVQEIRTHLINTDIPIQCIKARLNNVVPVSDGFCASWSSSSSSDLFHFVDPSPFDLLYSGFPWRLAIFPRSNTLVM